MPALTTSPSLYFWHANAFASSSVKNVSLRREDRRAAALVSDFGDSNETYQVLRVSNVIEGLDATPIGPCSRESNGAGFAARYSRE